MNSGKVAGKIPYVGKSTNSLIFSDDDFLSIRSSLSPMYRPGPFQKDKASRDD